LSWSGYGCRRSPWNWTAARKRSAAGCTASTAQACKACWLNLHKGWLRIFRKAALAGRLFANRDDIEHTTTLATSQLNSRAHPCVWGRPASARPFDARRRGVRSGRRDVLRLRALRTLRPRCPGGLPASRAAV
jgi:hypothetical protein